MTTTLFACARPAATRRKRVRFDGTYYFLYDAEGNRTAKYRSATGALDDTATDITTYAWNDRRQMTGLAHRAAAGAEPDEVLARPQAAPREPKEVRSQKPKVRSGPHSNRVPERGGNMSPSPLAPLPTGEGKKRIAFVSPHCLVDSTNGAATATRDGLKLLAAHGFHCSAFCGTRLDEPHEGLVQESLFRRGIAYEVRKARIGDLQPSPLPEGEEYDARLIFLVEVVQGDSRLANAFGYDGGEGRRTGKSVLQAPGSVLPAPCSLPVTLFENGSTQGSWITPEEAEAFLAACDAFLRQNKPAIVVTYGGDRVSLDVRRLARRHGAQVVLWLHNFGYADRAALEGADCVVVPSEFSRRYYRERFGLECHVLPYVVHWEEAEVGSKQEGDKGRGGEGEKGSQKSKVRSRAAHRAERDEYAGADGTGTVPATLKYVTFINPQPIKGVYVFARIARELAARRPDIPLLVAQGRSRGDALTDARLGLEEHLLGELRVGGEGQGAGSGARGVNRPHRPTPPANGYPVGARPLPEEEGTVDARNITTMPFTPDPQAFYRTVFARTKLLLMPSLWNESFGLVAAEAMLNGIPVLASNRGALPETVAGKEQGAERQAGLENENCKMQIANWEPAAGRPLADGKAGFLFDIPARYTGETREVPSAEEVEPWVETIIRLWDDAAYYERCSRAARERAEAWRPERLAPLYREFFGRVGANTAPEEARQRGQ